MTGSIDCCKRLVIVDGSLTSLGVVEDDYRKPDPVQLIHGDHVHRLVQFDVVEVESGINPSHSKAELQLQDLLDLFDLLDHHDLHTDTDLDKNACED